MLCCSGAVLTVPLSAAMTNSTMLVLSAVLSPNSSMYTTSLDAKMDSCCHARNE